MLRDSPFTQSAMRAGTTAHTYSFATGGEWGMRGRGPWGAAGAHAGRPGMVGVRAGPSIISPK